MYSIKSNRIRWALSAIYAILILFSTFHSVFSIVAFLCFCLMMLLFDKETILLQMFFIMPMANIFKLAPGSQSFFTIILLLYIVMHLVLPRKATAIVVLFAAYVIIGEFLSWQFNLFRTIKLICNVLFLSSILNSEVDVHHREISLSYIIGNVVASFFGMMDSSMFKIVSYVGTVELGELDLEENTYRFTGLHSDPNYYAVGLIISLCLLIILYYRNEIKVFSLVLFASPIVYFLIQTYSKSAILMLLVVIFMLLYSLFKKGKYIVGILVVVAAIVVIYLALTGRIEALEIVLTRLSVDDLGSDVDVNAVTTGRFDLWILYANHFVNSFRTALLGCGISSNLLNGHAAHNTYLDIIYFLGSFGGALLFLSLYAISEQSRRGIKIKRNLMNYSVLACILIMYFFLSAIFYFDAPFHIFLGLMVLNLPLNSNESDELEYSKKFL